MTHLSETQHAILISATRRPDRLVLPLPQRIRGGAAAKVIGSLLAKSLIATVPARPGDPIWRATGEGPLTLVATEGAFQALGHEAPEGPDDRSVGGAQASGAGSDKAATQPAPPARKTRTGSKQAQLIALFERRRGASIEEIVTAFGWQPHTVRGAIAGTLKKKLGLQITSEKVKGRGRVYRIARLD